MTTTANIPDFNPAAMITVLAGDLLAFLLPTDCLRSLENRPPYQRAFRQSVGNPEAIYPLYYKVRQQSDGNCTGFFRWTGHPFLSPLKQIEMATTKGPGADKIMNDRAYERTRENPFVAKVDPVWVKYS